MSLIKFTPEQRAAISKAMTQFFINNGTYAYDSLKNDWGGGKYIKGDYKDISGEPLFDKLWDKAFVDHVDKIVLSDEYFEDLERDFEISLNMQELDRCFVAHMFTESSFEKAITSMENDFIAFMRSEEGRKAFTETVHNRNKRLEELRKEIERMGFDVTIQARRK